MTSRATVCAAMAILLGLGGLTSAYAAGLETPAIRFMLTSTPEGAEVMSGVLGRRIVSGSAEREFGEFLRRLESPEMAGIRSRLESSLGRGQEMFEGAELHEQPSLEGFSLEEANALRLIARRQLRLRPSAEVQGEISFMGTTEGYRARLMEERFLRAEEPAEPAMKPAEDARRADPATRTTALERARGFFEDMEQCLRTQPPGAERKRRMNHMLRNVAINEAWTIGGNLTSGADVISLKNLSADIFMTAISSVAKSWITTSDPRFMVRWVRVTGYNYGRSGVDAVYYYVTPFKDTYGMSAGDATMSRLKYNMEWNTANTVIPIQLTVDYLMDGLMCLHPGARMTATAVGVQFGMSAASSIAYFRLRRMHDDAARAGH